MPTASDLVTDLPADFETFGQAVATSMADLLGGTTGQVLSKASNTNMDFTWVTTDDANAIQNSIVDAKGDLIAASANDTPARLAVGANGETLVADSSTSTGLKWAKSPNFVGASVYPSGAQTIGNATYTALTYNTENFDTDAFHSTVTNTSRITIPSGLGGYYRVSGMTRFNSNATGRRLLSLYRNGASSREVEVTAGAVAELSLNIDVVLSLSVGDYLEFFVYQSSGGNLTVVAGTQSQVFEIEYLGA
jgi:hypothetical protein